jgi:hypothetical protein
MHTLAAAGIMGAGRRTQTYDVDTRNETNYRFEQQQKNLGAQLGGVIFSELHPGWPCLHPCLTCERLLPGPLLLRQQ